MRRTKKPKRPKKVAYTLIADSGGTFGRPMYDLLRGLVREFRGDLKAARIALAWCTSWREDVDGREFADRARLDPEAPPPSLTQALPLGAPAFTEDTRPGFGPSK